MRERAIFSNVLSGVRVLQVPGGAAGLFLLGRIARLSSRQQEAAKYYSAALERDPLLWHAFQELCQLGAHRVAALGYRVYAGPLAADRLRAFRVSGCRILNPIAHQGTRTRPF